MKAAKAFVLGMIVGFLAHVGLVWYVTHLFVEGY